MDQFYVTLLSNTISDRGNSASEFTVHLPQKLRLSGEWECGLCQIMYPHNWEMLRKNEADIKIIDVNNKEKVIKIPGGCYDTIKEFIETIQFCIRNEIDNAEKWLVFLYHHSIKRVYVKLFKEYVKTLVLPQRIADILGFHDTVIKTTTWAVRDANMSAGGGLEVMYVYANILEPQIVGDVSAPLLRIVNVEGEYPNIIDKTFDFPHYIPVLVKDISHIEINIKDDLNQFVRFVSGKVIVKLHFRKIKHSYF